MTTAITRKLLALCSLAALLGAASLPAAAQGTGWYGGISAGMTSFDVCDDLVGLGLTSCDDDDSGFKVYAGNRFSQNFSAELGWVDLGEITLTGPGGTAKVGVDGIQIAGLGMVPVSPQVSFFGKVGLYLWDLSASGPGGSLSDDGADIMFGLGLNWSLAKQLDLRVEWEQFDVDGDDVNLISVGVQFRF
jgi:OOP family OmpA-OmpF porin